MDNSIGRLRLFLAAGIVVAVLPLGVTNAKVLKPSRPSDETNGYSKDYCKDNLVQKDLGAFERYCTVDHGGHPNCKVDLTKLPSRFRCCCYDPY